MEVPAVAERSAVVFLLTSATNVAALVIAGAGLATGLFAGPQDLALSAVPAGVGVGVLLFSSPSRSGLPEMVERHGGRARCEPPPERARRRYARSSDLGGVLPLAPSPICFATSRSSGCRSTHWVTRFRSRR